MKERPRHPCTVHPREEREAHVPPSGGGLAHACAPHRKGPHPVAISFGHDRPWGGVSQHEYLRMAQNPTHQLAYRVHFAAIGWADRHGHAGFAPGRLAALAGQGR
ncbi:hypothetical protein GTY87_22250 [Streptomyces sp. SID7813]|uniref:Uncharacterized protein n=1 Tax=Streptomyces coelicolor (strain ATCC BAA-471 / A3(2) / M145) TaxID=100226 RepID=Q9KXL6_STRCO|nr:conserved hypothetical protein [Streptomyces lividans TK24]KKD13177.1 hypothetical protein TR66_22390 [Streptomyces sp. WM6391]MYU43862.1 hypothetical protein [Streptomyces sp. SID7813]NSL83178.1 hypothetical protein [Streptomyces coelicolor]QFI44295.1 hypothetical protein FQ762_22440 [Streptomyces coelicolor A3(2)]THA99517.1 hypothetical protein E6R61_02950 [Streptomyces sp. LRa12]